MAKRILYAVGRSNVDHCEYQAVIDRAKLASQAGRVVSTQPYPLTQKQVQALEMAVNHSFSVITGGAGTGKTTLLKAILEAYKQCN